MEPGAEDARSPSQSRTKFIPAIPGLLFESPGFFPVSLHLANSFAFGFFYDVLLLYQKAICEAFVAGRLPVDSTMVRRAGCS
jgi:hypothetical protein